jgi:hypothetical protein
MHAVIKGFYMNRTYCSTVHLVPVYACPVWQAGQTKNLSSKTEHVLFTKGFLKWCKENGVTLHFFRQCYLKYE